MTVGIIYHTDKDWFKYLVDNNLLNQVNFWTTRTTDLKANKGDLFFFKTKDQEIVGFADYLGIEHNIPLREAWNKFGPKNGVDTLDALIKKAENTLRLKGVNENTEISYIILDNIVSFRKPVQLEVITLKGLQTYAKIKEDIIDKIFQISGISTQQGDLKIQNVEPKFTETLVNSRAFQQELRKEVIRFYNQKCVFCGIDNSDLLVVSHIKPVNQDKENAGKIKNTLLLCSLHDSMFDKGLISINKDGSIMISEGLKRSQSERLKNEIDFLRRLTLSATDLQQDFSSNFFEWHRLHVFKSKEQ